MDLEGSINNKGIITWSGTINFRKPLLQAIVNDGVGTFKISSSGFVNIDTSGDKAIVNYGAFEVLVLLILILLEVTDFIIVLTHH
jgi:hypothetical protein